MTYVKRSYYTRMLVAASNPSSDALAGQHVLVVDDHDVVHWGAGGADAVLDNHDSRRRNPGSGDWLVRQGRLAVIYDWRDGDDATAARVITVWSEE
jgi:hypothetical protein